MKRLIILASMLFVSGLAVSAKEEGDKCVLRADRIACEAQTDMLAIVRAALDGDTQKAKEVFEDGWCVMTKGGEQVTVLQEAGDYLRTTYPDPKLPVGVWMLKKGACLTAK